MTSVTYGNVVLFSSRPDVVNFCTCLLKPAFEVSVFSEYKSLFSFQAECRHLILIDSFMILAGHDLMYFSMELRNILRNSILLVSCDVADRAMQVFHGIETDFMMIPCDPSLLLNKIMPRVRSNSSGKYYIEKKNDELLYIEDSAPELKRFIGNSYEICCIRKQLHRIADTDFSILFQGESGTGKTLLAEITHALSSRAVNELISVNMATIPENIAESELFGTVSGAFTGAVRRRGYFMKAHGGTLFMDEIAELSLPVQAKLLHVLETGKFRSLGSTEEHKVDVRFLCASNANLEAMVKEGRFRRDLYYRIADFTFEIPPLRERRNDIREIAEAYLNKENRNLSFEALEKLKDYSWPGNIRQLLKCLRLTCVMSKNPVIMPEDIIL